MRFSEYFKLKNCEDAEWFDPLLFADTPLFIDPFLIFDDEKGAFYGKHQKVISFFERVFSLIAETGGDKKNRKWQRATDLLTLREVGELCLGYAGAGNPGAGSGKSLANDMAQGIWAAIAQGMRDLNHFEEVQIFSEGIGPDRISDATAGILRDEISTYTEAIAKRYKIPVKEAVYRRADFSQERGRWISKRYQLPRNPYSNEPILLVPKYYLRPLPTINAEDFWEFAYDAFPDLIRDEFGEEITRNVDKKTIVKLAIKHPNIRQKYIVEKEHVGGIPYDLEHDPNGYYLPYMAARGWANDQVFNYTVQTQEELISATLDFLKRFKNYVENREGWRLLWNDDRSPKKEYSFQALLMASLPEFCRSCDIDVSREANIGRGPVDFKLSNGFKARLLIEAKRANNTKFWHGLEKQLPKYLEAEEIGFGIFLVACQREKDFERIKDIQSIAEKVTNDSGVDIRTYAIDCMYGPPSASKLP